MIALFNEDVKFPLSGKRRQTKTYIADLLACENKKTGDLNIIFCSDVYLKHINIKFLNHDYFTDVITFDYCDGNTVSGDIYISTDRVNENAELFKTDFNNELHRVIFHGILHLCGYKDATDAEISTMRAKENEYIQKALNGKTDG